MTSETMVQIRKTNDELNKKLKEWRMERVAKGLPADPPAPFVPLAMGWALFSRCKPLIKYATSYALICEESDSVVEIPEDQMKWVNGYEDYVILIERVDTEKSGSIFPKVTSCAISGIYNILTNTGEYETANQLIRDLHINITFTSLETNPTHRREIEPFDYATFWELGSKREKELYSDFMKEVERLKDDDYFNKKLLELLDYHESIKHLY